MRRLRDAPGSAEMEDYYESDYVPLQLIDRYNALQFEKRKRTMQQFIGAMQTHSLAPTDGPAAALHLTTQPPTHTAQLTTSQGQPEQQLRSSLRFSQRRSNTADACSSVTSSVGPRQGPRTSLALDAIYAVRKVSRGNRDALATSSGDVLLSTALHPSPPFESPCRSRPPKAKVATTASANARPPLAHTHKKTKQNPAASPDGPLKRDLYDGATELRRQEHFLSESKRLGKPFVPSGSNGLDVPTRFMLGDCVKALYRSIVPNWRMASPTVVSTAEDLIAVYFSLEKLEKAQVTELLQYMNASLLHNAAIREFHLTKVPEGWDVLTNDGYVLYTFRPPWVKKRVFLPDTINPLHAHLREGEA
ncbi:hypothetical protein ABL78_3116 [Leptomonas seymouri]|uniref:Uncharacterized protein n=1 Tax=Leptomonas seymouri TaxID=5684 RepID=A0A0N0P717_LEPSE|nr:hypothetical protein ABL78_3116 [Leptomonas seymouri]|eukprot:KPI87817.1 hypothetical protein ABL78_3116 [Leptomonas seymouri]